MTAFEAIPGGSIGIVYRGVAYQYYWGYADVGRQRCMSASTVMEIGSITKTFTTALLAMALAARPDLSLEQNPARWIDVLSTGNAVGPNCPPPPQPSPVPASAYGVMATMTIEMLATHTSGLPPDAFPPNALREWPCYSSNEFVHFVETYPRARPAPTPPHPWKYSNAGFGTLGYVLQGVNRRPWLDQVKQQILGPLHMAHTYGQGDAPRAAYATGYDCDGNRPVVHWPDNAWSASGSLRSTLPDMLVYLGAAMQQPGVPRAIAAAMKLAQTPTGVITPGRGQQALAWSVDPVQGFDVIDKDGATAGFNSWIAMVAPASGTPQTGVVVLVNRAGVGIAPTPPPKCRPQLGIPAVQIGIAALDALEGGDSSKALRLR
ncbi:MAG TPA: serine hydrolase domain-containing protein [Verrucomicrobiae bacterium]|nr:serine hydrolase domain-containing protein [Verrucomicrobiae bacterium]